MKRAFALIVAAYFLAMAVAVTYPGYLPANRIRPLVLGLPFSLAWQVFWILGSIAVLGGFYLWEKSGRSGGSDAGDTRRAPPPGVER